MKGLIIILSIVFSSSLVFAQFSNFNTQRNWSMNKKEFVFGGGATQFLGDLGGGAGIGKDYSLADMNFARTRYNFTVAYRYRFKPAFATTTSLNVGRYTASDKKAGVNEGRARREIDIKSTLISFYQRVEYLIYVNEKVGKRNSIPGLHGMKDKNTQAYIFSGLGIAYYAPQAGPGSSKWEGTYLRPLHTEGQGYSSGAKAYKVVTAIVPFGFGYRVGLGRMWRCALEATYFKTFTDYMDDVSTSYFSYKANGVSGSEQAIYFSNPTEDWTSFQNGDKRGDKQKDAFFYVNLTFSKNITYKNYERGKPIKWRGVRAKF